MKFDIKKDGMRLAVICLAAVIMAVNIKSFVRTGGLYPGGATGLTLLLQRVFELWFHIELPYTLVNVILNGFPVYLGFRFIGKKFTLYSVRDDHAHQPAHRLAPRLSPSPTTPLLISIFGGLINALCHQPVPGYANATTGGTDFIAIYLAETLQPIDAWNSWSLVLNVFILMPLQACSLAGTRRCTPSSSSSPSTQVLQHDVQALPAKRTLFVVTNHAQAVYEEISKISHHGATVMDGEGSYQHEERKVVYSVVSSDEAKAVIRAVHHADPKAFINVIKTDQVQGRFYQRPNE